MKNTVAENIRLEINKPRVKSSISIRKGDTKTREIHATLTNNGSVYDLENALVAVIFVEKPDGTKCYNDCVISGNEIQYTITTQTINVLGECICQFEITFDDGAIVTSPEFSIMVYEQKNSRTDLMSQNEYTGLTQHVVMAKEYADAAKAAQAGAEAAQGIAELAQSAAETAKEEAEAAQADAKLAQAGAEDAQTRAETSEQNAKEHENVTIQAKKGAETAQEGAEAAKADAELAKAGAEAAQAGAETSEQNAKEYANAAETAKIGIESAQSAAETAQAGAEAAKADAVIAQAGAEAAQAGAEEYYDKMVSAGKLELGTDHNNAYYGDLGKKAYDHSNITAGNPHGVTYEDVGADKEGLASECYQNAVAYTDKEIAALINGAPETLDTLKEIADAMENDKTVVEALNQAIGTKANQAEFETHENNETIHITADEREMWNSYEARLAAVETLLESYGYPVDMTTTE